MSIFLVSVDTKLNILVEIDASVPRIADNPLNEIQVHLIVALFNKLESLIHQYQFLLIAFTDLHQFLVSRQQLKVTLLPFVTFAFIQLLQYPVN